MGTDEKASQHPSRSTLSVQDREVRLVDGVQKALIVLDKMQKGVTELALGQYAVLIADAVSGGVCE